MWVLRDITPRGIWRIGRVEVFSLGDPSVFCKDSLRNFRAPRRLPFPRFGFVTVHSSRLIFGEIFPGPPLSPLSSPCSLAGLEHINDDSQH